MLGGEGNYLGRERVGRERHVQRGIIDDNCWVGIVFDYWVGIGSWYLDGIVQVEEWSESWTGQGQEGQR